MLDLQLIAENLLTSNQKLKEKIDDSNKPLIINSEKLITKYLELKDLDIDLIKFSKKEDTIFIAIPYLANSDNKIALFDCNGKQIDEYELISYKLSLHISTAIVKVFDCELIVNVFISKTGYSAISKSDNGIIEGNKDIKITYLEEKIIFIPIKDLPLSEYKLVKKHKKRTKKYGDLLVDLECLKTKKIYHNIAVNTELEKLIHKYEKETKFSIVEHQEFTNQDGVFSVKTIIKDLNFSDNLSDLDI